MGSVTNSLTALSWLTQPGGLLSNLPTPISTDDLQSASPQDLTSLSMAAIEAQNVNELFGTSQSSQITLPMIPLTSQSGADVLPGVAASDLANATPQQQAAINNQAVLLQQVHALFGEPTSSMGMTTMIG